MKQSCYAPCLGIALILVALQPFTALGAISKKQRACIVDMNKRGAKVAQAQGREIVKCVATAVHGDLPGTIEECLTADLHDRIASALANTDDTADQTCTAPLPPFGYTGAATTNTVAVGGKIALFHSIFGDSGDAFGAPERCQFMAMKATEKVSEIALKSFKDCKKTGLRKGTILSSAALSACAGADAKGRVEKAIGRIDRAVNCLAPLDTLFPGCEATTTEAVAQCLETAALCRSCLIVEKMDALQTSCDTIDDGVLNGSCPECGNGVTEHGEQCDDAGDSATCDANCTFAACGDRYLNAAANEQCDDGNVQNGDCCDSACVFEPDGSPCNDGNICTAPDSCDGAGHCDGPAAPVDPGVCLAATRHGSTLTFKQNGNADKLSWKWKNLDLITNFDDPRAVTYTLCLYKSDGVTAGKLGRVRLQTTSSLWTDLGTRGYKYKDRARGLDGARTAKLKPGNPKKGNIKIKAKGPRYSAPALPLSPNITEIVAQLRYPGGGPCFEARFVPPYNKQTSTSFKDISE